MPLHYKTNSTTAREALELRNLINLKAGDKFIAHVILEDNTGDNVVKHDHQEMTVKKVVSYKHNGSVEVIDTSGRSYIILPDEDDMDYNALYYQDQTTYFYKYKASLQDKPKGCVCELTRLMNQGCRCGGQ